MRKITGWVCGILILGGATSVGRAATQVKLSGTYGPDRSVRLEYTGAGAAMKPYVVLSKSGQVEDLYLPVHRFEHDVNDPDVQTLTARHQGREAVLEVTFAEQGRRVVSARVTTDEDSSTWPVELWPPLHVSDELLGAAGRDRVLVTHWASTKGGIESRIVLYQEGAIDRRSYVAIPEYVSPQVRRFVATLDDGSSFHVVLERRSTPVAKLVGTDGSTKALRILELGPPGGE